MGRRGVGDRGGEREAEWERVRGVGWGGRRGGRERGSGDEAEFSHSISILQ